MFSVYYSGIPFAPTAPAKAETTAMITFNIKSQVVFLIVMMFNVLMVSVFIFCYNSRATSKHGHSFIGLQSLGSKHTALPRGAAMHHDVIDFSHTFND